MAMDDIALKAANKAAGALGDVLHSNKGIGAVKSLFGGGEFMGKVFSNPNNSSKIGDIIGDAAKSTFTNAETGALNMGKIAGSYVGASAAYRVASGGGAYRDKNGNANIIGVPFV